MANLSQSEKTGYINRIKQAAKNETVDAVVTEAKGKNDANLLEVQRQATINSVKALTRLTDEEKTGFVERINAATSNAEFTVIFAEADELDRSRAEDTGE